MDYELKYVIAICFLVKIAALSPEFSISEETEKLEQIPGLMEAPHLPSLTEKETLAPSLQDRGKLFDREIGQGKLGLMKVFNMDDLAKSKKIKRNRSFETCVHKLELLKSSLKWRDIRKTLHWLDRILASNQTNVKRCPIRKNSKKRTSFHTQNQQFDLYKTTLKNEKSTDRRLNWGKNSVNDSIRSTHLRPNNKFKKEPRSWKKRSRKERNKKEKFKSKRKESRYDKKYFPKADLEFSPANFLISNTTILKPNSVLFDIKKILFERMKSKNEIRKNHECRNSVLKIRENCEELKGTETKIRQPERGSRSRNSTEKWSPAMRLGENANGKRKTKLSKQKPWPHFVYHRVSSNFLHPNSTDQNHKQSAYVAISVVTASKPESDDHI